MELKKSKAALNFFIFTAFFSYYILFFLNGTKSSILIDDVLNNELLNKYLLQVNDLLFETNQLLKIEQPFGGLPLHYIHSQYNFYNIPFYFLNIFWSYIINDILIRVIGFFSMRELLIKKIIKNNYFLSSLLGLLFAFIPIYSIYGITLLGAPLVYIAYLNTLDNKLRIKDVFFVIFYCFYSVPFTYPFILLFLSISLVIWFFKTKKINKKLGLLILIFLVSIIILKSPLIFNLVIGESHRNIASNLSFPSVKGIFYTMFKWMIYGGETHPAIMVSFPIMLSLIISKSSKSLKILLFIIFLILLKAFSPYISLYTGNSNLINFALYYKIIFLLPFIFFIMWAHSLNKNSKYSIFLLIVFFGLNIIRNYDFSSNIFSSKINDKIYSNDKLITNFFPSRHVPKDIFNINLNGISFSDYISKSLFDMINSKYCFKENKDIIITYGLDPSILLLNDFHTASGYFNNYPSKYNLEFRKIQPIESENLRHVLELKPSLDENIKFKNGRDIIDLSTKQLKHMKIKYIFSNKLLSFKNRESFKYLENYRNNFYNIYIYKIL